MKSKILNIKTLAVGAAILAVSACNLSTAPDVITVDTGYALINGESIACEFDGKTYDFGWVNKDEYLRQILVRRFNSDTATVKQRMQIAISGITNFDALTIPYTFDAKGSGQIATFSITLGSTAADSTAFLTQPRGFDGTTTPARDSISLTITARKDKILSGTFSGKTVGGKLVKNGTFAVQYKF